MPVKVPQYLLLLSLSIAASTALFLTLFLTHQNGIVRAQTGDTPTPEATAEHSESSSIQDLPPLAGKLDPPKYANMDSHLNQIVEQVETGQSVARIAAENAPLHSDESVAVTLYIAEGYAEAIVAFLEDKGASPRNVGTDYIEAYVPVSLLPEASTQEGVISVQTIIPPQPAQGAVVSEGAEVHGATAWHDAGLKGQGVKIGIIDAGFLGFSSLMGTELPSNVEARCYTEMGEYTFNLSDCDNADQSSHGTAVAEALFDIAPEATYYIASPITGGDVLASVTWMIEHDVEVINMSLAWTWSGPGDGSSRFSYSSLSSVDAAVSGGIVWVNSAGNEANNTWYGAFSDADGDDFHEFRGTDECNDLLMELEAGERFIAMLRWDDSWTSPSTDLDLHLVLLGEGNPRIVFSSEDDQNETLIPFEWIRGAPTNGGKFCLALSHEGGPRPAWIQLQAFTKQALEYSVPDRTIVEPADSANPGLLAVGAAPWSDTFTLEPFNSHGPTLDGRIKPDIVGADRGQSVTHRSEDNPDGRWTGTSQASPHVAGLAALVRQQFPDYTPQEVATYLKNHAEGRGAVVPNNFWGYGFARLLASDATAPGPTRTPSPTSTPEPTTTPEPTATPAPTGTPADNCVETLDTEGDVNGSWSADCESSHPDRNGRYARFYTFTLAESAGVTVTLESSTDPYIYLREGVGTDGTVICENDDYASAVTGSRCDRIDATLDASTDSGLLASLSEGSYTIEATTYEPGVTGDFTLTLQIEGSTTQPRPHPTPSPTPAPLPPGYNIVDHACNEDDISHLGGSFVLSETVHPPDAPGYSGITAQYETRWTNLTEDKIITCTAIQFDSIQNARWIGLNYSKQLQQVGTAVDIREHDQAFIPWIGDDTLAYLVHYHAANDFHSSATVNFLDADTITVSRIIYFSMHDDEFPDIAKPEGVALQIASRVFPADEATVERQSVASLHSLLEAYGWLERVLD